MDITVKKRVFFYKKSLIINIALNDKIILKQLYQVLPKGISWNPFEPPGSSPVNITLL